jgi:hypothetical protein
LNFVAAAPTRPFRREEPFCCRAGDITITAESNLIFGTDLGIEYRSFFYPLFRNDSRPYRVFCNSFLPTSMTITHPQWRRLSA